MRNRFSVRTALAVVWATVGTLSLATTVYVSDAFDDGGISNGADAMDVAWTKLTGDNAVAGYLNNQLVFDNARSFNSGNYPNIRGGLFSAPTLQVGDKIQLTFDFKVTLPAPYANPANQTTHSGSAFRFGLGNANLTYALNFGSGSATGGNLVRYDPNVTYGTATTLTTSVTPFAIHDNAWHAFSLTLERTASNQMALVAKVDGHTVLGTHAGATAFAFDRIILGQGAVCNLDMLLDNFRVTDGIPATTILLLR